MKKSLFSAIFMLLLANANMATAQIELSFSIEQPSCHGFTNGTATVNVSGGNAPYTYLWSNGQTTQTNFGIGAGTYSVTVTDANSATATGSTLVSQPNPINVAITATGLSCDANSGSLTATAFGGVAPYSYAWEGAGGSASGETIAVTASGNYFVTVTDDNGCAGNAVFTVASPLSLEVIATDIPCSYYPTGGAVNATVTGGTLPYTYSWSNGSTAAMLIEVGADNYELTITAANGCTATDGDVVDIPSPLEVEVVWLSPACNGNNGSATVLASGGTPPYTHSWTPGGFTGASVTGLAPGTYYVCTFDANACQKDIWVEIPATTGLDVHLSVTSATCIGINDGTATAIVNPPGNYTYQWAPTGETTTQITGLAANTVVTVTVTDPATGCTGTATAVIGAHNTIDIDVDATNILCAGGFGSATATASGGTPEYAYTWYAGGVQISDSSFVGGLLPGAYVVSVVDAAGCMAQSVANIGILSAPVADIDGGHVLVCGDSVSTIQFVNQSTDTYNTITHLSWLVISPSLDTLVVDQQNQITLQVPVDENVFVQLIVTSGLGCSDTVSLVYNVPGYPDVTLELDSTTFNCSSDPVGIIVVSGDSTYTYVWNPAVVFNPDPLHVLVDPSDSTTYVLTVTDGNACTAVDSITVVPGGGLLTLSVSDQLIQTCSDSVILTATANIASANIVWTNTAGDTIPGNPITVPATPDKVIYTATASTADGCEDSEEVSVTGYGVAINIDTAAAQTGCVGIELPLSVSVSPAGAVVSYEWSVEPDAVISDPTAANPTLLADTTGDYTVTVIVKNDFCSDTLSFQIHISPNMNLNEFITADLCEGRIVSFFNTSGMPGEWAFGDGTFSDLQNPVHTYATSGEFMVIFTPNDLNCMAPWDSMIHVQQAELAAGITSAYEECALKAKIQFNGSVNNPGDVIWDWSFSNGDPATSSDQNPTITYENEGAFIATLVVTDENGCTATISDTVQVDIVNDEIAESFAICLGDSLELNPEGIDPDAAYTWTANPTDPTLVNPNDPNPIVAPVIATLYGVEISQGLCTVNYEANVTIKDGADVDLPNDSLVISCTAELITLTALSSDATGFEWSNSPTFTNIFANTQTVSVPPPGVYYVRATNGAECSAIDSIVLDLAMVEIQTIPNDNDICAGEEAALMVDNLHPEQTLTYVWSPTLPNGPNQIVSPLENTTYSVIAMNEYGCSDTLLFSVNVTNVSVTAEVTGLDTLTNDETTTLLATPGGNGVIVSYEWSPAGSLSDPNSAQTEAYPKEDQVYTVLVTTIDGCTDTAQVAVYYRQSPCEKPYIFIPNTFTPNGDNKNDLFIVRGNDINELRFIVWNRWGEIVFETNDPNTQGWDGTYKGVDLTPDSYAWYVWLTCGNGDVFEDKGNVTLLK
ncbi:MAG: PKD domain-containing protein [Saprospiraceae bacterium]|nr:PKD domain-containing protein [Saprospiraceae bacterium]